MKRFKKRISIITATKNSSKTIDRSIKSFFKQDYKEKELIIIDGNSTDKTIFKVKQYKNKISKLLIESDKGIYDALNKGLYYAKGDIIGILHSDDKYHNKYILSKIMKKFNNSDVSLIHTNVNIHYKKIIRQFTSKNSFDNKDFSKGEMPPHTGIFFKKEILSKIGNFDIKYEYASDLDFIIKCFNYKKVKKKYYNLLTIDMYSGGKSTKSLLNILKQNIECIMVLKKNKINFNLFVFFLFKLINRISQIK